MKKSVKRFAAIASALLIAAVPTQTFAASNCNVQNLLGSQVKGTTITSYSNLLSGKSCGLAKNLGLDVKDATVKVAAKNNACTANLAKYFGKDCTSLVNNIKSGNTCTGTACPTKDCTGKDCTTGTCAGSNCNTGNSACTGADCTTKDCTGKDCTTGNAGSGNTNPGTATTNNGGNTTTTTNNTATNNAGTVTASSQAQQVTSLVNKERAAAGLNALTLDASLSKVAQAKAEDMAKNGYFSHTSPTYGSPFDMMKSFGIKYSAAGENIAKGQKSADSVMTAWMNSSGHRANILNSNYEKIGVGYTTDAQGNTYWVQMFIK